MPGYRGWEEEAMDLRRMLSDVHERSHRGFATLIEHCGRFSPAEFRREREGFGVPSLQAQFCHVIGAERYWLGVLEGRMDVEDGLADDPGAPEIERSRREVFDAVEAHLARTPDEILECATEFTTWGDVKRTLVPSQVLLRTQMHLFQHQGQITAMCRQLGAPINGIDYPHGP
ncbi:MAG: DinB family protein [Planctomycetota bacterium]